jgi:Flp pilus assembly protein TadG
MSIEALFWFITTVLIAGVFVDASAIFHAQSNVLRIMQDANRAYSVGMITTPAAHKAYIEARLAPVSPTAEATSSETNDILTTVVTVPAADFQILGIFRQINSVELAFTSRHLVEDWGA